MEPQKETPSPSIILRYYHLLHSISIHSPPSFDTSYPPLYFTPSFHPSPRATSILLTLRPSHPSSAFSHPLCILNLPLLSPSPPILHLRPPCNLLLTICVTILLRHLSAPCSTRTSILRTTHIFSPLRASVPITA
ncbi:hypothetical protein SUGI_0044150 [Cryptomeria japonica]|nr:hypothetical protein SUGI_0044150 [Cryptomeria japonica]